MLGMLIIYRELTTRGPHCSVRRGPEIKNLFFFFVPNLITLPLLLIGAQWSRDRYGRLRPGRGAAPASGGRLNPRSSLGGVWRRWPAAPGSEAQLGTPGASQVRSGLTYLLISGRSGGVAHAAPASSSRL